LPGAVPQGRGEVRGDAGIGSFLLRINVAEEEEGILGK
jgi:hypothetical protein